MGVGDGFKFGIGFFLAGLLLSLIPGIIALMAFGGLMATAGAK